MQAASPFGFAGQQRDAGPGTYAMRARTYAPGQGRFTTVDPLVGQTGQTYAYAGDAPTIRTDPSGQDWVAVADTGNRADNQRLRDTILNNFVQSDASRLTYRDVTVNANSSDPQRPSGHADLVSLSPKLHSGMPYGEVYALVADLQPVTGAPSPFSTAELPDEQALLRTAYLHGLHVGSGPNCRNFNHINLVPGIGYPVPAAYRDTAKGPYFTTPYTSVYLSTARDVYLSFAWQRGPGVIGYTVCRWQTGPGVPCRAPPTYHQTGCPEYFSAVGCALDLLVFGGSGSAYANCPTTSAGCQNIALLGIVASGALWLGGGQLARVFVNKALAALGPRTLARELGPATAELVTHDGETQLLTEAGARQALAATSENLLAGTEFEDLRWEVQGLGASIRVGEIKGITYGGRDAARRAQGIIARLDRPLAAGSEASRYITPPGYEAVEIGPHIFKWARGHLLGKQLGGDGTRADNLVTR